MLCQRVGGLSDYREIFKSFGIAHHAVIPLVHAGLHLCHNLFGPASHHIQSNTVCVHPGMPKVFNQIAVQVCVIPGPDFCGFKRFTINQHATVHCCSACGRKRRGHNHKGRAAEFAQRCNSGCRFCHWLPAHERIKLFVKQRVLDKPLLQQICMGFSRLFCRKRPACNVYCHHSARNVHSFIALKQHR